MCIAQITAAAKVIKSPRLNPNNPDFKVSNTRPIATIKIDRICFLLNFSQPNKNKIIGTNSIYNWNEFINKATV